MLNLGEPGDPCDDPEGGLTDSAHPTPARADGAAGSAGPDGGGAGHLALHPASSSSSLCSGYDVLPQALASTGKLRFPGTDLLVSSRLSLVIFLNSLFKVACFIYW